MHSDADLALLQIVPSRRDAWARALGAPVPVVFAEPGTDPLTVTATGFPDATLTDTDQYPAPEQIAATLLPLGGGPVTGRRPVDLDTRPPENARQWKGMSGAALHEQPTDTNRIGRLVGVITDVTLHHTDPRGGRTDWERCRLHASLIPDPTTNSDFDAALQQVGVTTRVLEDHYAPYHRELLEVLDRAGRPYPLGRIPLGRLRELGPRHARTDIDHHGNPYYPFVHRPSDQPLVEAVEERLAQTDQRALLLVGPSMTGKSRTLLETLIDRVVLSGAPLLVPGRNTPVDRLPPIVRRAASANGWVIVWFHDISQYTGLTTTHLRDLLAIPGTIVAATLRSDEVQELQDTKRVLWAGLSDVSLVQQMRQPHWNDGDIDVLERLGTDPRIITIVRETGQSLGTILGGGPELVHRLRNGSNGKQALVNLVAGWHRTGRTIPLPESDARALYPHLLTTIEGDQWDNQTQEYKKKQWKKLLKWATKLVVGAAPLVTIDRHGLTVDPYIVDDRNSIEAAIPPKLWQHALETASVPNIHGDLIRIGFAASRHGLFGSATKAYQLAALSPDAAIGAAAWFGLTGDPTLIAGNARVIAEAYRQANTSPDPNAAAAAWLQFGSLIEDSDLTQAEIAFNRATGSNDLTTSCSAWLKLGQLLKDRDAKQAEEVLRRATQSPDPKNAAQAWHSLGGLLENSDPTQAVDAFLRATTSPDLGLAAAAWYGMGTTLEKTDPKAALDAYQRATENADPIVAAGAWISIGILLEPSDFARAAHAYRQATMCPIDLYAASAWIKLGALLEAAASGGAAEVHRCATASPNTEEAAVVAVREAARAQELLGEARAGSFGSAAQWLSSAVSQPGAYGFLVERLADRATTIADFWVVTEVLRLAQADPRVEARARPVTDLIWDRLGRRLDKLLGLGPSQNSKLRIPVVTPIVLEVSDELVPIVDSRQDGGHFLYQLIPEMRDRIRARTGVVVPGVRARGNPSLPPGEFVVQIDEVPFVSAHMRRDGRYRARSVVAEAVDVESDVAELHPVTGEFGRWCVESVEHPTADGATFSSVQYLVHQIERVVQASLPTMLGIHEVETLLQKWRVEDAALVSRTINGPIEAQRLTVLLQELVGERVPILQWRAVLMAIADAGGMGTDLRVLQRTVRFALRKSLPGVRSGPTVLHLPRPIEAALSGQVQAAPPSAEVIPAEHAWPALSGWLRQSVAGLGPVLTVMTNDPEARRKVAAYARMERVAVLTFSAEEVGSE